ncbi:MAG: ABC transporter substrate-binding protein [Deltaproteobacteria bacterium]|nr:ABC transporter substrate-binding protein [Deltaproteobacteria bacterium]
MKKVRSLFDLRPLRCFMIVTLILSSWIIAKPCSSKAASIKGEKNRLVFCISPSIVSLDPTNHRSRDTQIVLKNMFDSLTTRDANMKVVPQLAESWQALNDTTWEFRLRRGVKFHNGDDFTAEDVKFTLERVVKEGALDGKTSPRKGLFEPLSGVKIIDDYTVHIKTEKPWPILPLMLALQEILPNKYLKRVGTQGFLKYPIGTGPFKFVRREEGKLLILERFEDYYGGSPEIPPVQMAPLKYLIFKIVPIKVEQIAMLKKGECDIITRVPSGTVLILRTTPGIKISGCPATRSYFAEINCTKPPLNDPRIRLAMNYAADMQAVVDHILQGFGTVLPTVLLPNAFAYNSSLKPYTYNPKLAKKLLNDSGFPESRSIAINCLEDDRKFASVIASFLTRVGVKSAINVVDHWRPEAYGKNAKWDIFVGSWGNSTLDPVGILVPKFKTDARGNFSKYSNGEADKLFSLAEGTLDPQLRENYYKKIQEIIYKDAPMIFGYAAEEFYGLRKRVKNFMPSPSGMMNMHDVYIKNGK